MKKIMTANKKVLSLILALTMCVTMLMPLSATAVAADNTSTSNDTSAQSTAAVSTTTADRKAINLDQMSFMAMTVQTIAMTMYIMESGTAKG